VQRHPLAWLPFHPHSKNLPTSSFLLTVHSKDQRQPENLKKEKINSRLLLQILTENLSLPLLPRSWVNDSDHKRQENRIDMSSGFSAFFFSAYGTMLMGGSEVGSGFLDAGRPLELYVLSSYLGVLSNGLIP
jgi:hypothetical protein